MKSGFEKIITGYNRFRKKYAYGNKSIMRSLAVGQQPQIMMIACCDSRVDPALILQCDPGDLFVVRNVANIVPPYEHDDAHHGTSAALEFGINILQVKDLILFGHSQCGGILSLIHNQNTLQNDFISNWMSIIATPENSNIHPDDYAKLALQKSLVNCLEFPSIQTKVAQKQLAIHLWFFDIKSGKIFTYAKEQNTYLPL